MSGFDPARPAAPPVDPALLSEDEAALVADAYIEALLAAGAGATSRDADAGFPVDPDTARAVDALTDGLVRYHPSFRFEERLAARLREVARGRVAAGTSWVPGDPPVVLRADPTAIGPFAIPDFGRALPDIGHEVGRAVERVERVPVPVLVGGAIASGVSLAGAAIVAWRLSRRPLLPRLP